jgi:hypothetical protein
MLRDDNGVSIAVKLDRLSVRRIDHRWMTEHFSPMATNAIKAIEAPDFLLGPSSRLRMGKDTRERNKHNGSSGKTDVSAELRHV